MRTTLTLDDDLARALRQLTKRTNRSFKEVVNETLRRGLSTGRRPKAAGEHFRVRPKACGFRPGVDLLKLNQLVDELQTGDFGAARHGRSPE
jgi:hypothetical protein